MAEAPEAGRRRLHALRARRRARAPRGRDASPRRSTRPRPSGSATRRRCARTPRAGSLRDEYGRYGNPTWRAAERKLCELEGAEAAVLFASGMCAATTTLPRAARRAATTCGDERLLPPHAPVPPPATSRSSSVEATVIEPADTIALKDAIRDEHAALLHRVADEPVPARDRRARGGARRARARREGDHRLDLRDAR